MKKTILFVDDELINLFVLERRFEEEYNILTAESAEEAIQTIEKNKGIIDVIITDLKMIEMDGLQLIETVRPNIIDVPCFLLTGYDYSDHIQAAIDSKKIEYQFKKPFDYDLIHSKIKALFDDG